MIISVVNCGYPSVRQSVTINVQSTEYGSVAQYACLEGYELNSGSLTRTCQSDTSWSGQSPTCKSG